MSSIPCSVIESNLNSKSSNLSWKEIFRSASYPIPCSDPFSVSQSEELSRVEDDLKEAEQSASFSTPEIRGDLHSSSMAHSPNCTLDMFCAASFRRPKLSSPHSGSSSHNANETNKSEKAPEPEKSSTLRTAESSETKTRESKQQTFPCETQMWLAVYLTLAQAGLAFFILLLYGFFKLLEEYVRPIIWASLCSIPLRGIQEILLEFWSEPLKAGLSEACMALPIAILRACLGTIIDARDVISCVFFSEKMEEVNPEKNGFLRLFRRLVSFGLFVFVYEHIGRFGGITLIGLGFMFSSNLPPSTISAVSTLKSDGFSQRSNTCCFSQYMISKVLSRWILSKLKTILAVGLILGMIIGSLGGVTLFSYKIGDEGKNAVIAIKSHIEESKYYAEKMGIKKWLYKYENSAMEFMDWYASECYETLLQEIDNFAANYNLSELVGVIKQFLVTPNTDFPQNSSVFLSTPQETKYTLKLSNLIEKPVLEKAKCFATQGMNLSFQLLSSNKFILDKSALFLLYMGKSILSGATSLMQFLIKATVFIWVLYYLLTSESGGVTEKVMKFIPIPKPAKSRCTNSLNNAISGVLLATAEIAFFQGCFTWLLCRLFSTHFVYVSTLLAFISPLLPIFPSWLATFLGALELVLDGRYVLGIGFCITHIAVMDYGASEIVECVPGYSTYLTGVSIIGGITLFPSALEGAIMGPLITTVVIALKDLYTEFVLNETKEKSK